MEIGLGRGRWAFMQAPEKEALLEPVWILSWVERGGPREPCTAPSLDTASSGRAVFFIREPPKGPTAAAHLLAALPAHGGIIPLSVLHNHFGIRDCFCSRQFFHDLGSGDGFGMIQAHIYCALYFYHYYYISSTSDHQALDHGGWGLLLYIIPLFLKVGPRGTSHTLPEALFYKLSGRLRAILCAHF